jgi:hypothetical protein
MIFQSGLSYRYKGGSGRVRIPPSPPPSPTPTQLDEEFQSKERAKRRQRITAAGRAGTILTEQTGPTLGDASLLGRSS